jgi:hypothetical protein
VGVNLKELFVFFGLVTRTLNNVSYLLCQAIDINAQAGTATPIFFGFVISCLAKAYDVDVQRVMAVPWNEGW